MPNGSASRAGLIGAAFRGDKLQMNTEEGKGGTRTARMIAKWEKPYTEAVKATW